MDNAELLSKLNKEANFHLTFKVIQITSDGLLDEFKLILDKRNIMSMVIKDNDNLYEQLKEAKENNISYLLINEKITILLPLVTAITKDTPEIIKPMIDVLYMLKDNKIIQHIKTACNKKSVTYTSFRNKEDLFNEILKRTHIDE